MIPAFEVKSRLPYLHIVSVRTPPKLLNPNLAVRHVRVQLSVISLVSLLLVLVYPCGASFAAPEYRLDLGLRAGTVYSMHTSCLEHLELTTASALLLRQWSRRISFCFKSKPLPSESGMSFSASLLQAQKIPEN